MVVELFKRRMRNKYNITWLNSEAVVVVEQMMKVEVRVYNCTAVFVSEGIFKGLDRAKGYFDMERRYYESESAY